MYLKLLCAFLLPGAVLTAAELPLSSQEEPKKVIHFGWGDVSPEKLRDNVEKFERQAPFNGIGLVLKGTGESNGKKVEVSSRYMFQRVPFRPEWFARDVEALKNTKFKQFTDNFVVTTIRPGGVDWFDDAAWKNIVCNFGVIAGVAREAGCAGLVIDPEFYMNEKNIKPLFRYDGSSGRSFDETWAKARERGRAVGAALAREFPKMDLLFFFQLSYAVSASHAKEPFAALKHHPQGLFVAYVNGLYDTMGPEMTFHDGNEEEGYRCADGERSYRDLLARWSRFPVRLIAAENREKYLARTKLATSVYMDGHFPLKRGGSWDLYPAEPENSPERLAHFSRNLAAARRWSGKYVWVWSEHGRWWDRELVPRSSTTRTWNDIAPGLYQSIRRLNFSELGPEAFGLKNLLPNSDFSRRTPQETPLFWSFWRPEGTAREAQFKVVEIPGFSGKSGVRLKGFDRGGNLSRIIPVKPEESYLLRASVRETGTPAGRLCAHWKKPGEKRFWWNPAAPVPSTTGVLKDGVRHYEMVVDVPPGVGEMSVSMTLQPQKPDDEMLIDRIEAFKL